MDNIRSTIDFSFPDDKSVVEVINEILKKNGLGQSFEDLETHKESNIKMIHDASLVLFHKRMSEDTVSALLAKHLNTSAEKVKNIVAEIKVKIIPYITVSIVNPVKKSMDTPDGRVMERKIKNVEENAKELKEQRETSVTKGTIGENMQNKSPARADRYREPID